MKKYNIDLIEIVLEEEPSLTGFGLNRKCDEEDPIEIDEVLSCLLWLSSKKQQKNINYDITSYGYKHAVENWLWKSMEVNMYISNGAFIAAAILLDIPYESDGGPNIFVALKND